MAGTITGAGSSAMVPLYEFADKLHCRSMKGSPRYRPNRRRPSSQSVPQANEKNFARQRHRVGHGLSRPRSARAVANRARQLPSGQALGPEAGPTDRTRAPFARGRSSSFTRGACPTPCRWAFGTVQDGLSRRLPRPRQTKGPPSIDCGMRQGQICELADSRVQQSATMNLHGKQSTRTRVYGAFEIPTPGYRHGHHRRNQTAGPVKTRYKDMPGTRSDVPVRTRCAISRAKNSHLALSDMPHRFIRAHRCAIRSPDRIAHSVEQPPGRAASETSCRRGRFRASRTAPRVS